MGFKCSVLILDAVGSSFTGGAACLSLAWHARTLTGESLPLIAVLSHHTRPHKQHQSSHTSTPTPTLAKHPCAFDLRLPAVPRLRSPSACISVLIEERRQ
jgi:hypothetical protein